MVAKEVSRLPNYWIIALPRADMVHCVSIGKFGKNISRIISSVREGDKVVCYLTKEAKIIGLGTVNKGYYTSKLKAFLADGEYSHRFNFDAEILKSEIDFRTLVKQLRLTKDSQSWGPVLRLGIARLAEDDWNVIEKLASSIKQ